MKVYRKIDELVLPKGFKPPTVRQQRDVEKVHPSYIFFKNAKDKRILTATCCKREGIKWDRVQRTMDNNTMLLSYGRSGDTVRCPFCGEQAILRDVSRLGMRKALETYIPVVFISRDRGDLRIVAAWTYRDFSCTLLPPIEYKVTYAYKFSLKERKAYEFSSCYDSRRIIYDESLLEGSYNPKKLVIHEPFEDYRGFGNVVYPEYLILGGENVAKSDYKYCGWEFKPKFREQGLLKYLALYTVYPRQVEMLFKSENLKWLIDDMLLCGRKNSRIFDWNETDFKKAFKLTGQEMRTWTLEYENNRNVLVVYNKIRQFSEKDSMKLAANICEALCGNQPDRLASLCKEFSLKPSKVLRYLEKIAGPRCYGAILPVSEAFRIWQDYINMCRFLDYDLTAEPVIMPKDLELKHNEAAAEQTRRLDIERRHVKRKKAAFLKERSLKYNFEYGDLAITVAPNVRSITAEGKALRHCVGGYASRHIEGQITILFLRHKSDPDTPYVTVEMQGNILMQAHGYKNEVENGRRIAPSPRELHKEFFEKWLAWLKAGSKRNEDGSPKLPKKRKTKAA